MAIYTPKLHVKPGKLVGLTEKQVDEHWKLYEGYVTQTNKLLGELSDLRAAGKGGELIYADRRRRFAFEMGGMVTHEYYFENLKADVATSVAKDFAKLVAEKFGSFEAWLADYKACASTRGVGWAMCFYDPATGDVSNHFVGMHSEGHLPGFDVLLCMDIWEHAFLLDFLPTERAKYIEVFMQNVDWGVVEARTQASLSKRA